MNDETEALPEGEEPDIAKRPQDDYVSKRRRTPDEPPPSGLMLSGLLGDSPVSGRRRMYLGSANLNRWVEFRAEDVTYVKDIPEELPPFVGEKATAVILRAGAVIEFTRSHTTDEFDIDPVPCRWPDPGSEVPWPEFTTEPPPPVISRRGYCPR